MLAAANEFPGNSNKFKDDVFEWLAGRQPKDSAQQGEITTQSIPGMSDNTRRQFEEYFLQRDNTDPF